MAATIATATGYDQSRIKETHRLGSVRAVASADTWETFTRCSVSADGSGTVEVRRGQESVFVSFEPERGNLKPVIRVNGTEIVPIKRHWGDES